MFEANKSNFNDLCIDVFKFQYQNNAVYKQYCDALKINDASINHITQIPFLPISFFKTHTIKTTIFNEEIVFESSGTTNSVNSRHYVKDLSIYSQSFNSTFKQFYGLPHNWCIIGLLPSYLERGNSSLVAMVDALIKQSNNPQSGFYLYDTQKLHQTILHNEIIQQPTLLIGVTYALLDFAQQYPMQLKYTTVIETGGMKGRREELTRQEVHQQLTNNLGVSNIHSEYGMTELLSQAYAIKDGVFYCPPWMKILLREEDDPFTIVDEVTQPISGLINIIDLANLYSCSFIATDDVGKLYSNNSFEVLGRKDNSDVRGCSLMVL
ncbi:MAG: acyl transferase [Chitinophagaceae bacterium]|nr:acyl transferase [Chitinophagaceae bacterium]